MEKIINKQKAIFLVLLLLLIVLSESALHGLHLIAWPAFMVMVLFFVSHRDIKQAPKILLGGAFGIFNLILIKAWYNATVPWFGGDMSKYTDPLTQTAMFHSKLIYICLFVTLILLLKDVLGWIFNDYAFLFFLAAGAVNTANTAASVAAKTVAGAAAKVAAAGSPSAVDAMKAATDKALAASVPVTNVYQWLGIELIGGAVIIAGLYGIAKLIEKIMGASAQATPDAHH